MHRLTLREMIKSQFFRMIPEINPDEVLQWANTWVNADNFADTGNNIDSC